MTNYVPIPDATFELLRKYIDEQQSTGHLVVNAWKGGCRNQLVLVRESRTTLSDTGLTCRTCGTGGLEPADGRMCSRCRNATGSD